MEEQNWKRVEYDTWDAAFKGLVPQVRQQSVRVASYARELFVQACSMGFGKKVPGGYERMTGKNADVVYKCGMYHQLGKALVPPEYQLWQPDFTEEEQQLFRKYPADGRILVAKLQMQGTKTTRFRKKEEEFEELPTENIPWLMIREACEQHMERWDGSGYPNGRAGDDISPVAQIVGLALALDELASGTRSESPFEDALEALHGQAGVQWNPELIRVLDAAKDACREVYVRYIHYTLALPKTIQLVERTPDRVMGLSYRPIMIDGRVIVGYEANPWFGGIQGRPGEVERLADIEPMLRNTGLTKDVAFYLLYEAADTVLRIQNCKLGERFMLVQMPDDLYNNTSYLKEFAQLFEDQPINKNLLMLTVSEACVKSANKGVQETISRYLRNEVELVLDNFHPDQWEPETLKELGFRKMRLAPDVLEQPETADSVQMLRTWGFSIMAAGVDSAKVRKSLFDCGVESVCGAITGEQVTDDQLIRDAIVRQFK